MRDFNRSELLAGIQGFARIELGGHVLHEGWNLVTNAQREKISLQLYGTSGLLSNGFNYLATTNDALATFSSATTALTNENSGRNQMTVSRPSQLTTNTITNNPLASNGTSITLGSAVTNAMGYVAGTLIQIDNELITLNATPAVGATTLDITGGRGAKGTTAASHSSGATVTNVNTTYLTVTLTLSGTLTFQTMAVLTASSSGTIGHILDCGGTRTLQSGDQPTFNLFVPAA